MVSRVTPHHLYVHSQPVGLVSDNEHRINIDTLENRTDAVLETVQWGFGYGRAAVTTLALYDVLAISLFAW